MGAVEVTHGKDAPDGGDRSAVDLHKPGAPASVSSHAAGQHPPGVMAGHSVRVAEGRTRRPHRGRLLLAAGALGLAGAVGFQVTGQDASAVFGSSTLHVRSGRTVHVGAMFGSVKVVVPDNAQVDTSGGMVFGSMQCESACGPKSDAPYSITIDGKGAFGSIEVVTESEAGRSDSEGHSGSHDAG